MAGRSCDLPVIQPRSSTFIHVSRRPGTRRRPLHAYRLVRASAAILSRERVSLHLSTRPADDELTDGPWSVATAAATSPRKAMVLMFAVSCRAQL